MLVSSTGFVSTGEQALSIIIGGMDQAMFLATAWR